MTKNKAILKAPKAFISYSWDDDDHRNWVRELATRLRSDGVETILDQWHAAPGDQLSEFMERAVRENDYVLIICTPSYKEKSDQRVGGVGYEGSIMTAEVFTTRNQRKFIPILRKGDWRDAAPSWVFGKYYVDLRGRQYSEQGYMDLLLTLHGQRQQAPPLGPPLKSTRPERPKALLPKRAEPKIKKGSQQTKVEENIADNVITTSDKKKPLTEIQARPAISNAPTTTSSTTYSSWGHDHWNDCVYDENGNCINDNQKHWGSNE